MIWLVSILCPQNFPIGYFGMVDKEAKHTRKKWQACYHPEKICNMTVVAHLRFDCKSLSVPEEKTIKLFTLNQRNSKGTKRTGR